MITRNKSRRWRVTQSLLIGAAITAFVFSALFVRWPHQSAHAQPVAQSCSVSQITSTSSNYNVNLPSTDSSGNRIAFNWSGNPTGQNPDGSWEVFIYNAATGTFVQVTDSQADGGAINYQDYPVMSADGTRLAIESERNIGGGNSNNEREVFLYNAADGAFLSQVTNLPGYDGFLVFLKPAVSRDAGKIAFQTSKDLTGGNPDQLPEIFLYSGNGGTVQVTNSPNNISQQPSISADGDLIAFESDADLTGGNGDGNREIFVYRVSTASFTQITQSTGAGQSANFDAVISPDGTRVTFRSTRDLIGDNADGNVDLFSYELATGTLRQITRTSGIDVTRPTVNADGSKIAFAATQDFTGGNADGNPEIFLYDLNTDSFTQITNTTGTSIADNYLPSINWAGDRIAFVSITNINGGNPELNAELFIASCGAATPTPTGLTVSPSTLDFGVVPVEKTKDLVLTVTNNTAAPITLAEAVPITQASPEPFDASSFSGCRASGARTLNPGDSCTQIVRFWSVPGAGAASPASLRLLDGNTFGTLVTVPLLASVGPPDTGPNSPPIAVDDLSAVTPGFTQVLDATRNDSDPDNDRLRITAVSDPPNGTASIVSCGSVFSLNPNADCIQYSEDAGFQGIDSIDYTISDGRGGTATATYHLAVGNVVPNITAISPNSGPVSGGQSVRITGSNFLYGSEADFVCSGSILPLKITQRTDTDIYALTPPRASGACDVRVRTLFAQTGTLPNGYTYSTPTPGDTTPPVITPSVSGTLGGNGWYVSDVQVSWSVVDNESTVTGQTGCGTQIVSSDTGGITFTCMATSAGGTSSQSVTVKRDATPPTITFSSRTPAPNANGWNNTNVTAQWNCSDALSGPQNSLVSFIYATEAANQPNVGTCYDQAGNSASASQGVINIDKTPPTLAPVVSPNPVVRNGVATASPNAADTLSGIATQSCASVNTSTVGSFSVSCTATDKAGNTASASASYQVVAPATNLIVFSSWDGGNYRIFKMNSDGTGITRLTNGNQPDFAPALSPDKTRIAFSRGILSDIYVMFVDGSGLTRLTTNLAINGRPAWSPDGTRIAFHTWRYASFSSLNNAEIAVMNANGSNVTRLTFDTAQDTDPVWSPDGTKIAFTRLGISGNFDIYTMNADGTGVNRVTSGAATDAYPTWSPDGTKIAFISNRDGNFEIYWVNANGTGPTTRLTNNTATDTTPDWGADGRILFASNRTFGNYYVYVMNADGSGVAAITTARVGLSPDW